MLNTESTDNTDLFVTPLYHLLFNPNLLHTVQLWILFVNEYAARNGIISQASVLLFPSTSF